MNTSNEMNGLRVVPNSMEAERAVLGSILFDPLTSFGKAKGKKLSADMFFDRRHQLLFEGFERMIAQQFPMDAITIAQWLKDEELLERVGGVQYLVELQDTAVVPAHVESYSDTVIEKYQYRSLITLGTSIIDEAYQAEVGAQHLLQSIPGKLVGLMNTRQALTNQQVLDAWFDRMEAIKRGEMENGLPLPWAGVDHMMCGLQPGLIVVGARPSAGKTTMEVNLADFLAQQGIAGARACLDMSHEQLLARSVIRESRVSMPALNRGWARWNQVETVRQCKDLVAQWPFHIITDRTLNGICTQVRMLKLKYDIQYVTIDFLTQIRLEKSFGNRSNDIGIITSTLKALAFELEIPVLLLSQLNRGSAKDERPPRLDDLRESGDIEQDATQVLLISKALPKQYANIEKIPPEAEARILRGIIFDLAKNQQGETGRIEMWMRPNYFRLVEAEEDYMDVMGRLSEFRLETTNDEMCDPSEPCVCDNDVEIEED